MTIDCYCIRVYTALFARSTYYLKSLAASLTGRVDTLTCQAALQITRHIMTIYDRTDNVKTTMTDSVKRQAVTFSCPDSIEDGIEAMGPDGGGQINCGFAVDEMQRKGNETKRGSVEWDISVKMTDTYRRESVSSRSSVRPGSSPDYDRRGSTPDYYRRGSIPEGSRFDFRRTSSLSALSMYQVKRCCVIKSAIDLNCFRQLIE